jgi:hypothetical protein
MYNDNIIDDYIIIDDTLFFLPNFNELLDKYENLINTIN